MLSAQQYRKIVIGLGVVLALLLCGDGRSQLLAQPSVQDSAMVDGEQLLVLKNGEMLIGRIEQDAANLIVHVRQGSRLVISKKKAEFVCNSKSEAFWGKAARIRASDADQQVALFRWCLKHKMFEHAETQFNVLMDSDISAAQLESLNRQFAVLRASEARQEQRRLAAVLEAQQPEVAQLDHGARALKPLPRLPKAVEGEMLVDQVHRGEIQQASFTTPVKPVSLAATSSRPEPITMSSDGNGFAKVGAIPDLKRSHSLDSVVPVVVDPYDASRFNAETKRRKSSR